MPVLFFHILWVLAWMAPFRNMESRPLPAVLTVDTAQSKLVWKAYKVAGSHTGTVGIASGTLTVANGLLLLADVRMDMRTMVCTDLASAGSNAKLLAQLKGEDFFNVPQFPSAQFRTTAVRAMDPAGARAQFEVDGMLTIKGVRHANTFYVQLTPDGKGFRATGSLSFDRTHYGIRYGGGSFFDGLGDSMIKDMVELEFDLRAE